MNAPIVIATIEEAHRKAIEEANQWRGRMINLYARAENQIGRALASKANGRLPMLFSQKISQLKKLIVGDAKLRGIVEQLEARLGERNSLVHGVGSVWVAPNGRWLLELSHHGRKGVERFAVQGDDAEAQRDDLAKIAQRLESKLKGT